MAILSDVDANLLDTERIGHAWHKTVLFWLVMKIVLQKIKGHSQQRMTQKNVYHYSRRFKATQMNFNCRISQYSRCKMILIYSGRENHFKRSYLLLPTFYGLMYSSLYIVLYSNTVWGIKRNVSLVIKNFTSHEFTTERIQNHTKTHRWCTYYRQVIAINNGYKFIHFDFSCLKFFHAIKEPPLVLHLFFESVTKIYYFASSKYVST